MWRPVKEALRHDCCAVYVWHRSDAARCESVTVVVRVRAALATGAVIGKRHYLVMVEICKL